MKYTEEKTMIQKLRELVVNKHFKKRFFSAVVSLAVVVAVVFVNIGATALESRFPLTLDLTSDSDFSLSSLEESEHLDFIKGIDYKVDVTVCTGSSDITAGTYEYYMTNYYMYTDSTGGKYFTQVKALIEQFSKLNSNITVRYSSPLETSFNTIKDRHPEETFSYGDVLVECSFTNSENQEIERHRILNVDDLYDVEDESGYASMGYGTYTITGSAVEKVMTQALYAVTNEKSTKGTVFTGHGCDSTDALVDLLERNNYEFDTVSNLLTESFDPESEFLIVCSPTSDFTNEEIAAMQSFLAADDEHRQKTLIYIPDTTAVLTNFNEFLEEWDVTVHDATAYGIDDSSYYKNLGNKTGPYFMFADVSDEGSSYAPDFDDTARFMPATYRAVTIHKESDEDDTIASLLNFPSTAVGRPISEQGSESEWTTDDAKITGQLEAVCVAVDAESPPTSIDDEQYYLVSNLLCIASRSFVSESALSSTAYANGDYIVSLLNRLASIDASDVPSVTFSAKKITTDSFADEISDSSMPDLVKWVFMIIIPATTAVIAVVVGIRRKRR